MKFIIGKTYKELKDLIELTGTKWNITAIITNKEIRGQSCVTLTSENWLESFEITLNITALDEINDELIISVKDFSNAKKVIAKYLNEINEINDSAQ